LNKNKLYHKFFLRRKGKERLIHAPAKTLKWVQHKLLHEVLYKIPFQDHVAAYLPGRSCAMAAAKHVGKAVILSMDIKDFFTSIKRAQVRKQLRKYYTQSVAHTLSELMTYDNFVPQGAPTSGAIANLVAQETFDADILAEFGSAGWTYTRYSDDLVLSSNEVVTEEQLRAMAARVDEILHKYSFELKPSKTRWARDTDSQVVLGLVVNERVGIPRRKYHKLKAAIHGCSAHGFEEHANKLEKTSKDQLVNWLRGMLSYVHDVDAQRWAVLQQDFKEATKKWLSV
jgi:retron-type reverse transcriptase